MSIVIIIVFMVLAVGVVIAGSLAIFEAERHYQIMRQQESAKVALKEQLERGIDTIDSGVEPPTSST